MNGLGAHRNYRKNEIVATGMTPTDFIDMKELLRGSCKMLINNESCMSILQQVFIH